MVPLFLEYNLKDIQYLGPLREPPRPTYPWRGNPPFGVGVDGGDTVQALLASRMQSSDIERVVPQKLRNMGLTLSLDVVALSNGRDFEIRVKNTVPSDPVLILNTGFGVSQILPVIVLCYYASERTTLILEQPELHLHPAAQSSLADILIEVVKERKVQIIVESHSEHLLRRIQRRVAEGSFDAKDAALYFCEMENGESKARELELTDDGFIKNWPKDFFGDEMGDLAAMTEAAAKRHMIPAK